MVKLIRNGVVAEDAWQKIEAKTDSTDDQAIALSAADQLSALEAFLGEHEAVLVPLSIWQDKAAKQRLIKYSGQLGLSLGSGEEPQSIAKDAEQIAHDVQRFDLITIHFEQFTDGRGYSYGRELRSRYGFKGELRAVGDIGIDQIFYLSRCGFSAFELADQKSTDAALAALSTFEITYQSSIEPDLPLFRRRS